MTAEEIITMYEEKWERYGNKLDNGVYTLAQEIVALKQKLASLDCGCPHRGACTKKQG